MGDPLPFQSKGFPAPVFMGSVFRQHLPAFGNFLLFSGVYTAFIVLAMFQHPGFSHFLF
jgi:hypothetical protein